MGRLREWIVKEQIDVMVKNNQLNPKVTDELIKSFSNAFYNAVCEELKKRNFIRNTDDEIEIEVTIPRNEFDFKYFLTKQIEKFGGDLNDSEIEYYAAITLAAYKLKDSDIESFKEDVRFSEDFSECKFTLVLKK